MERKNRRSMEEIPSYIYIYVYTCGSGQWTVVNGKGLSDILRVDDGRWSMEKDLVISR